MSEEKTIEAGNSLPQPLGSAFFDGTRRKPVDKLAAMMLAGGEKYNNRVKIACSHWDTPPPMRQTPHDAPKLVGIRFGRFTVLGMHKTLPGSWVVRCSCGDFEIRKAKAIRNPNNFGDRCVKCRNVAFERKNYEFWANGHELDARTL